MKNLLTPVFSSKHIFTYKKDVTYVIHDNEGEWQFLSGEELDSGDLMMVTLEQMINHDESLLDIIGLQRGFEAIRKSKNTSWTIYPSPEE
jgi:hypothetical protein